MTVEIVPIRSGGRELERFIAFPYSLHRRDPLWVPTLRMDVRKILSPQKNPFFEHAKAQYFLALKDGKVVGRIAAIRNDLHNQTYNDRVGFYGFFESIDDQAVANALFDAAAQWLRHEKFDTMRGPMNPSINDECALLIDGFDTPPCILMTHNPRYYVALHDRYGFVKAKDMYAAAGGGDVPPERFLRAKEMLRKRYGLTMRTLDMKRFHAEVELVKQIFNEAWERNWGYVPMTEGELDFLAASLKPVIVPELIVFASIEEKIVGFAAAIPDLNVGLIHNRSGRIWGIPKVLWYARNVHRARIPLLGTLPQYRGKGFDAVLYYEIWSNALKRGINWGEGSWLLEDNAGIMNGLKGLGFHVYKTYRIYDKRL